MGVITGMFTPRSEHFIFAFANSKLSRGKRVKSGVLLPATAIFALLTTPFSYEKENTTVLNRSSEELYLDSVRKGSASRFGSS